MQWFVKNTTKQMFKQKIGSDKTCKIFSYYTKFIISICTNKNKTILIPSQLMKYKPMIYP